jgi:hypothetical protein
MSDVDLKLTVDIMVLPLILQHEDISPSSIFSKGVTIFLYYTLIGLYSYCALQNCLPCPSAVDILLKGG